MPTYCARLQRHCSFRPGWGSQEQAPVGDSEQLWRLRCRTNGTCLHRAVVSNCNQCIKIFVDNEVEKDAVDESGFTALHLAALNDDKVIFQSLIDLGVDPTMTTPNGDSALHLLAETCWRPHKIHSMNVLIAAGVDPFGMNNQSQTASDLVDKAKDNMANAKDSNNEKTRKDLNQIDKFNSELKAIMQKRETFKSATFRQELHQAVEQVVKSRLNIKNLRNLQLRFELFEIQRQFI